jgi:multiple sugar transport system permease protein
VPKGVLLDEAIMSSVSHSLDAGPAALARPPWRPGWHKLLHGSDLTWSIAFVLPYAALFAAFVIYPMGYGLWMGGDPSLYAELFSDPRYVTTAVNTVLFVGIAVNVQMLLALLLSGFFARRRRWIKLLLLVYILPWTLPEVPAFLSFHWMLVADQWGLIDRLLSVLFGINGPLWFNDGRLALACDIVAEIWKWMPLWTLIFLGARMTIAQDLYDAAEVDGATPYRRFVHITLPLVANLYLISTLIAAIWAFGDYTPVLFISDGTPAFSSEVLSTLGFHYAVDFGHPRLGVAAGLSALPLLVPLAVVLMRRLQRREVQL